jgi:hypothetical protein
MAEILDHLQAADTARLTPLINAEPKVAARPVPAQDDDEQFLDVRKLRDQYVDYLTTKVDEIEEQKDSRRYYHGAQYTAKQIEILRKRRQPATTWNRTNEKINQIVGVVERQRSDPKAVPRSAKSEQGSALATQVIRFVLEENDWKGIEPWCLLQSGIDGIAGVQMILTQGDQQDPDIGLTWVIGDEYFYDPKSYRQDFRDNRYEGISKWMDLDEAQSLFPDKAEQIRGLVEGDSDLTTNADREYKWVMTAQQRVRMVEHWYKFKGQWRWAFYVSTVLLDQGLSPFFDDKGNRVSPFHMYSVAVDHDGDRYGFVRNLRGPQDSLNQSKSKALHLANSRRLIGEKGAVDDVEKARIEWSRPDGYVELNPGKKLIPDDKTGDLTAFIKFGEDAGGEIDRFANINVASISGAPIANISGRAIELLRQPGMASLGPFILARRQWVLGLYRAIWTTAQRYWKTERWLRMLDNDQQKAQFIQVNGVGFDQWGRPAMVNALGALDVDIILEEGADVANMMQDTYDALKGYPPGTFPPQVLIELSPLPRAEKQRILSIMQPPPNPQAQQLAQVAAKLKMEGEVAKNAKTAADARQSDAKAQKAIAETGQVAGETQLAAAQFQKDIWTEAMGLMHPQQPQQPQGQPQPGQGQQAPQMQPQQAQSLMNAVMQRARRAPDGKMYIQDKSGRYHRLDPRGAQKVGNA